MGIMRKIYELHEEAKNALVGVSDKQEIDRIIKEYRSKVEAIRSTLPYDKCDTCHHKSKGTK